MHLLASQPEAQNKLKHAAGCRFYDGAYVKIKQLSFKETAGIINYLLWLFVLENM